MKRSSTNLLVKVLNRNLRREADSACLIIGYQPAMPDSVKRFKKKR